MKRGSKWENSSVSRVVRGIKESKISKDGWLNWRKTLKLKETFSGSVTKSLNSFARRLKRRRLPKRSSARKLPQQTRSSPKAIWRNPRRSGRITKRHGDLSIKK